MLSHFDITRAQQRQTESCSRRRVYAHRTIKKIYVYARLISASWSSAEALTVRSATTASD